MTKNVYICLLLVICSLTACSPSLREAQDVVAQADSLWHAGQMYGVDAGDSATLAHAYETLNVIPFPFREGLGLGSSYAHACYHYGKLLRAKGNPVAAMEVFINATHSRTRDYHILGRVYCNMGDICHLAGEYELSYDMFEQSGNMFLKWNDSLAYYFLLNDMAFELAEQGKKEDALNLLSIIEQKSKDTHLLSKVKETKADVYFNTQQYDSVLSVIDSSPIIYPAGYAFKARALWHLNLSDSALYYAQKVLSMPNASRQEQYNMLYIILDKDSTLQNEEIKALSEQRADIEHKMLVPLHKRYAVATKLLRLDIERTPTYIFLLLVVIVAILVISFLIWYSGYIHKKKVQQQEILHIVREEQSKQIIGRRQEIEDICMAIRNDSNWQQAVSWKEYEQLCEFVDKNLFFFAHRLKDKNVLNEKEIRLCILVTIGGWTDRQMADILYYSENSIRGIKRYTAKKLGTNSANLRNFLTDLMVNTPIK